MPQKTQNPALKTTDSQTQSTAVEAQNIALKPTDSPKTSNIAEVKRFPLKAADSQINPSQSKFDPRVKSARFSNVTHRSRSSTPPLPAPDFPKAFRCPKRERKLPQKTQNTALKAPDSLKTSSIAEVKKFPLKAADSQTQSTAAEAQNIALKSTDSPKKPTAIEV